MSARLEETRGVAPAGAAVIGRTVGPLAAKPTEHRVAHRHSLHRQRQWALWGSYAALAVFVVMFLVPPFYTLMTSLKSSAEISAHLIGTRSTRVFLLYHHETAIPIAATQTSEGTMPRLASPARA